MGSGSPPDGDKHEKVGVHLQPNSLVQNGLPAESVLLRSLFDPSLTLFVIVPIHKGVRHVGGFQRCIPLQSDPILYAWIFYGSLLPLRSSIVGEGNSKYSRAQNASNLLAEKLSNIHIVRSFTLFKDSSERCLVGSSFIQNTAANLRRGKCTPQQKRPLPNKHLFPARGYPGDLNRSCPVPCAER